MSTRSFTLACVLATFACASAGCQREGAAEKAGRQVDRAFEKAGDNIDRAADKLRKK